MKITWNDLIVKFEHLDPKRLTEDWTWLIGDNMKPIIISSIGDMFLSDMKGEIYWLNVGEGKFELVAKDNIEFSEKLKSEEISNEWFMFDLVNEIKNSGLELSKGKLFVIKESQS